MCASILIVFLVDIGIGQIISVMIVTIVVPRVQVKQKQIAFCAFRDM